MSPCGIAMMLAAWVAAVTDRDGGVVLLLCLLLTVAVKSLKVPT